MKKNLFVSKGRVCRMLCRFFCILFCVIFCVLSWGLPAEADVIWTPEDSFFRKHEEECIHVDRRFTARGPEGIVILYKSPELPVETGRWENGYIARISFTYEDGDGIVWGVYESDAICGWMPMEYMEVVYDTISFEEEYRERIAEQRGALDETYKGKEIRTWAYPGAKTAGSMTVEEDYDYMPEYHLVFTDETGNNWGKIGYYTGHRNIWVCLDRPEAEYEQLYPQGGPERGKREDFGEGQEEPRKENGAADPIVPKRNERTVITAVCMVTAVVLATAALLVIMLKRGKGKKQ